MKQHVQMGQLSSSHPMELFRHKVQRQSNPETGFTFVEMLLVLAVGFLLVGIGLPVYGGVSERQEEDRFFNLFLADVYYMQGESYRSGEWTQLHFSADGTSYTIQRSYSTRLTERAMPEMVTMIKTSNLKSIQFSPTGSVSASGTIRFATSSGERSVTVHLGKGRLVVSE